MKTNLGCLTLALAASAVICPCANAQAASTHPVGLVKEIEKGNKTGLGARLGVFMARNDRVASGFELGYARLSGIESELHMGPGEDSAELHLNRTDRRLWYATFTVRRRWMDTGTNSGLYAGAGTGLYYLRNKREVWEPTGTDLGLGMEFRESTTGSAHFGVNFGGGFSFKPVGLPGAMDLDARLHVLPFSGGSGIRSVLTFSAGLHLF